VTSLKREKPDRASSEQDSGSAAKRRYEKPRLVDYGRVSKLTQTGGITTKDVGSMERVCL
jgi:hypothetical protein